MIVGRKEKAFFISFRKMSSKLIIFSCLLSLSLGSVWNDIKTQKTGGNLVSSPDRLIADAARKLAAKINLSHVKVNICPETMPQDMCKQMDNNPAFYVWARKFRQQEIRNQLEKEIQSKLRQRFIGYMITSANNNNKANPMIPFIAQKLKAQQQQRTDGEVTGDQ